MEEYALEGQKKDVWHFSEYKSNPRKRIREGLHTSFYANGKDSLTEVYRATAWRGRPWCIIPTVPYIWPGATAMVNLTEHSCSTIPTGNSVERNTIQRISVPVERCSTSTELKWNISRISCFHLPRWNREPHETGGQCYQISGRRLEAKGRRRVILRFVVDEEGKMTHPQFSSPCVMTSTKKPYALSRPLPTSTAGRPAIRTERPSE